MDVNQHALTWVGWPNGEKLALTCVQIWSRPKWAQVIASQLKSTQVHASPGQKVSQVAPSFPLASTCDSVCPGLNKCVNFTFHANFCNLVLVFSSQKYVKLLLSRKQTEDLLVSFSQLRKIGRKLNVGWRNGRGRVFVSFNMQIFFSPRSSDLCYL